MLVTKVSVLKMEVSTKPSNVETGASGPTLLIVLVSTIAIRWIVFITDNTVR